VLLVASMLHSFSQLHPVAILWQTITCAQLLNSLLSTGEDLELVLDLMERQQIYEDNICKEEWVAQWNL
jgi:hypothetical protein